MNGKGKSSGSGREWEEIFGTAYRGNVIGREIWYRESVISTNDLAVTIGRGMKQPEGIVVVADAQSGGRGRLGRMWISPPKVNLYVTVILQPRTSEMSTFPVLMASVATVTAIREYAGVTAGIKWPNDIMINHRKAGGLLLEKKSGEGDRQIIALGIGINVNMPLDMLPSEIREKTTSLKEESGRDIDRKGLFRELLLQLDRWYTNLLRGDRLAILKAWRMYDTTVGRKIAIEPIHFSSVGESKSLGIRRIVGIAEGVDEEGRLLIRIASGEVLSMTAGDVTILRD